MLIMLLCIEEFCVIVLYLWIKSVLYLWIKSQVYTLSSYCLKLVFKFRVKYIDFTGNFPMHSMELCDYCTIVITA